MKYKPFIISVFAGILASLAWMEHLPGILIIFAFLLFVHLFRETVSEVNHHTKVFLVLLPGFLVYNILSFSWLHKVSIPGAVLAIMINTFMMSSVFWISGFIFRRTGKLTGFMTLVSVWLVYEHLTTIIPVFSPWLNPGNVFGKSPEIVQWFEYTGSGGGSLWVILSAILMYLTFSEYKSRKNASVLTVITSVVVIAPIIFSLIRYNNYDDQGTDVEFVVIQPNIDPYTEKFGSLTFTQQLGKMIEMADEVVTPATEWIIFPETAIDDPFIEDEAEINSYVRELKSFISDKPATSLLTGVTTKRNYTEKPTHRGNAALINSSGEYWFEIYNSAMRLSNGESPQFYHKSKLVPGIEQKFSGFPASLEKIVPQLGGTMSGYGIQETREVFSNPVTGTRIAPVICYESVFGSFITDFVKAGAEVICIITNDGWWNNTAGYRQHYTFASLRAIETRRAIVRTANTGISGFIDQKGKIIEESEWWVEAAMRQVVKKNDRVTFYTLYGDYIYRYADIFTAIVFILAFIGAPLRRYRYR